MLLAQKQIHIRGVEWKTVHNYSHLIFTKKEIALWRKDSVFNQWCWEIWILKCRRNLILMFYFEKTLTVWLKNFNKICDPEVARGISGEWASVHKLTQGVQSRTPEDRTWEEQLTNGISRKGEKLLYSKRNNELSEETAHRVWEKMCQSYIYWDIVSVSLLLTNNPGARISHLGGE